MHLSWNALAKPNPTLSLLEVMLKARVLELDTLSLPPMVSLCIPKDEGSPGAVTGEEDLKEGEVKPSEDQLLRRLLWHYGKVRFRWRSLLSVQEERARILHKLLSLTSTPSSSQSSCSAVHETGSAVLRKEVERLRALIDLQEAYLEWKRQEPLFWCWMDSVLACQLSHPRPEDGEEDVSSMHRVVNSSCSRVDKDRENLVRLDRLMLRLQTGLRDSRHHLTTQSRKALSDVKELEEIRKRVALRMQAWAESYTSPTTSGRAGYRPSLQGPETLPTHRQPRGPGIGPPAWDAPPDRERGTVGVQVRASSVIGELRQREELLLEELTRMSQARREEFQERTACQLEGVGVVFIPPVPLKR
ncbi:tubulin epsilon and delta complex protein 1 isoform X3 [Esox lucius]|uniref:tubulin epsilon and delta complex protein 1 isoform X3 n=1 Tax=Esox lucius TaxID=8010 RepID=UPI0005766CA1|nr:tubulin epsilon and delta complex protein 1 isoform X3 [Esox lucius]XP_034153488.1 tubulin epsilon and delta complex protein 1 isoform X3 [Esox lucius]